MDIRCSPIPLDKWIYDEYISVDICKDVEPTIVYDLRKDKWDFAQDNSYDKIIDTCGIGLKHKYKNNIWKEEIIRVLKPNGIFYGHGNFIIQKQKKNEKEQ